MRFLEHLDDQSRDELLALSQVVELARGEMLVRRGDRSDDLYLVESGTLVVIDSRTTPEVIISTLGAGALVGEMAFFEGVARTMDVRAEAPTRSHRWSAAALKHELSTKPVLAAAVYQAMASLVVKRARGIAAVALGRSNNSSQRLEGGEDLPQQASALVAPARTAWIEAERVLRGSPNDAAARRQLRANVERLLSEAVRWISGKGDPLLEQAAGEALARELHPFLTRSQTGALSLEGGEMRRVAHIILNERQGSGPLGECIDRVLLSLPTSLALQRRTAIASQTLLSRLPDRKVSLMALNVFSGVLLNRIFQRLARHGAVVTCLDSDRGALAAVDLGQAHLPDAVELRLVQTDLAMLCMGRSHDQHPLQDFIVVDGLMDYLPDQLAAGALSWCRGHLKPGGQVLMTGTGPSQDAPLFSHLLDWPMIRRSARDLRALADSVGLRGAVVAGGGAAKLPAVVVTATRPLNPQAVGTDTQRRGDLHPGGESA